MLHRLICTKLHTVESNGIRSPNIRRTWGRQLRFSRVVIGVVYQKRTLDSKRNSNQKVYIIPCVLLSPAARTGTLHSMSEQSINSMPSIDLCEHQKRSCAMYKLAVT
jgi:hypothetical protein